MLSDSTCGKIVGQKLRIKNKLTSLALKKITQPGRYSDGIIYILKLKKLFLAVGYLDYPLMAKEETWGLAAFRL